MMTGKELLPLLLKTVQLGQTAIRSVLDTVMDLSFRGILLSQLRELETIETEAHSIATRRGWDLREPDPATTFLIRKWIRLRLLGNRFESTISAMLIRRNTTGMIHVLQGLHQLGDGDPRIRILCQKLLDCQRAGIHQMQRFL